MGAHSGAVAIVTGASRGIGLGIAQRLVQEGARVVITARKPELLAEAVAALGGDAYAAGLAGNAADPQHQDDIARKILDVNVVAAFSWVRKAVAAGLGSTEHPGSVVNIASIAGLRASGAIGWYGVSKAALVHLTMELGHQLGPAIRVNAVAPAVVKTQFAQALYAGREEAVAAAYPMKRLGVPEDIAGAVSFLLSRDAGWLTGQTLVVDGGVTLGGAL